MSLNKAKLKNKIVGIMNDMMERENTSIEEFARRLSDAVDDYVKEAKIQYISGLVSPSGAVTGNFNGKLQ